MYMYVHVYVCVDVVYPTPRTPPPPSLLPFFPSQPPTHFLPPTHTHDPPPFPSLPDPHILNPLKNKQTEQRRRRPRAHERGQRALGPGGGEGRGGHHPVRGAAAARDPDGAAADGRGCVRFVRAYCMCICVCFIERPRMHHPIPSLSPDTHTPGFPLLLTGTYTSIKGTDDDDEALSQTPEVKKCKPRILLTGSALPAGA